MLVREEGSKNDEGEELQSVKMGKDDDRGDKKGLLFTISHKLKHILQSPKDNYCGFA